LFNIETTIINFIHNVLESLDFFGVFIIMILEPTALPIPGEILLPLAGWMLIDNLIGIIYLTLLATFGSTIGCVIEYFIAKKLGRRFILKYGKYLFISENDLNNQERLFKKYENRFVLLSRFIPLIPKSLTSIIAGLYNMNIYKYSVMTFVATLPTLFTYIYIGNKLGENYSDIRKYVGGFGLPILILVILIILFYFLYKLYKMKQS
jgi:membrane protein DedA with SNARE-associated domain